MLFVIREEIPPLLLIPPRTPSHTVQAALGCRTIVDSLLINIGGRMESCYEWYREVMACYAASNNIHNFVPVIYSVSQYTKQATTLMCSHCLQLIELKDVQEFNNAVKLSDTSDSA